MVLSLSVNLNIRDRLQNLLISSWECFLIIFLCDFFYLYISGWPSEIHVSLASRARFGYEVLSICCIIVLDQVQGIPKIQISKAAILLQILCSKTNLSVKII